MWRRAHRRRRRTVITHWERVDWPILKLAYELELENRQADGPGRRPISAESIGELTGLSKADLLAGFNNLNEAGLIVGTGYLGGGFSIRRVTPSGLQALGEWPSGDAIAAVLPQILEQLAGETKDSDKASALRRAADILQGVATSTLSALIREMVGLGG